MKVTIEELKGLNVAGYIDWMIAKVESMEKAKDNIDNYLIELENIERKYITIKINGKELQQNEIDAYHQKKDVITENIKKEEEKLSGIEIIASTAENKRGQDEYVYKRDTEDANYVIIAQNPTQIGKERFIQAYCEITISQQTDIFYEIAKCTNLGYWAKMGNTHKQTFECWLSNELKSYEERTQINDNAAQATMNEVKGTNFEFIEYIVKCEICKGFFEGLATSEFAKIAFYSHVANNEHSITTTNIKPIKTLNKTQFTEIVKALLESQILRYETEKQAVEILATILNVNIDKSEFDRCLQKIKGKNIGNETAFLDLLKTSFLSWMSK